MIERYEPDSHEPDFGLSYDGRFVDRNKITREVMEELGELGLSMKLLEKYYDTIKVFLEEEKELWFMAEYIKKGGPLLPYVPEEIGCATAYMQKKEVGRMMKRCGCNSEEEGTEEEKINKRIEVERENARKKKELPELPAITRHYDGTYTDNREFIERTIDYLLYDEDGLLREKYGELLEMTVEKYRDTIEALLIYRGEVFGFVVEYVLQGGPFLDYKEFFHMTKPGDETEEYTERMKNRILKRISIQVEAEIKALKEEIVEIEAERAREKMVKIIKVPKISKNRKFAKEEMLSDLKFKFF